MAAKSIYDLPTELLDSLTLLTRDTTVPQLSETIVEADLSLSKQQQASAINDDSISVSTACALCRATFRDVQEQRQHARSDFHRYNLKLSTKGIPPIDENTFIKQIGDLDESISGSESSDSDLDPNSNDNGGSGDIALATLLRRQAKISEVRTDGIVSRKQPSGPGNAPLLWTSSPLIGRDIVLGVYRAILSDKEQDEAHSSLVGILKSKQVQPVHPKQSRIAQQANQIANPPTADRHFFLCMIGGGHFAAAIINLAPEIRRGPGGTDARHAIVKAHKTFHRYTTRRKQGGSQSANDNAKGNAHSAGSSIRRYNEIALETDVRNTLAGWKAMIDSSDLIFIRASGTTSRKTLFGPYEGQVLNKTDPRLRGFPFSTRRATQGELIRAFQELTRMKVNTFIETAEIKTVTEVKPKPQKQTVAKPERSQAEEAALLHTSQLQNLIRRTKAPATLLYLTKNELSSDFEFFPPLEHRHSPRPLHLASSINSPALVTALLMKANADPTPTNADGKTAYQIAGDSQTRDAFRVARFHLGEGSWDWNGAHVPSAISPEDSEAKFRLEQQATDLAESERRKSDLAKLRQQDEQRKVGQVERKAGVGKALGTTFEKTSAEKREEELRGLTPEMRQKMERERRARAAEARLKALAGNK